MHLGATYKNGTCFFRIWAPNAREVHVLLKSQDYRTGINLLERNSHECWEGRIADIHEGDLYKMYITGPGGTGCYRLDPAARDTLHSGVDSLESPDSNACVISDTDYDWSPFETPGFENYIIYQLHVGSFAGFNDGLENEKKIATMKDVESKLSYIRDMGFNALELLPVNEFRMDRSWGYNPSHFFALEPAYGHPVEYRHFVDEAHKRGLAVIFDVVFNHVSDEDNSMWKFDAGSEVHRGIYLANYRTPWGSSFAFWKDEVKNFFYENAMMYFEEYNADGLRFDATRYIEYNRGWQEDGWNFLKYLTYCLKESYPNKYLIAEHLPDHDSIIRDAGFHSAWYTDAHHEFQRALNGEEPVKKLHRICGKNFGGGHDYLNQWNLVKYLLGSHDDCGDDKDGTTLYKSDWEKHRYFTEFFGGRNNWYARAKARVGWALNIAIPGNPLMFMGGECHHPGYWHDGRDSHGDHRFNWDTAGDYVAGPMRRMVTDLNWIRWDNPALRSETYQVIHENFEANVMAFKRWLPGGHNTILTVVNLGDTNFKEHCYGVHTGGQEGQWTQIFCSQDPGYDGWDFAGNSFYDPWTGEDGKIYINLPKWSVVMMRLK